MGAEFVNRERLSYNVHSAEPIEQFAQSGRLNAVNLNVPVPRRPAHEFVTHATSHQQRATTFAANAFSQTQDLIGNVHHNRKGGQWPASKRYPGLSSNSGGLISHYVSSLIITFVPRVDGRQLITCTRSILVSSEPAVCQSLTQ